MHLWKTAFEFHIYMLFAYWIWSWVVWTDFIWVLYDDVVVFLSFIQYHVINVNLCSKLLFVDILRCMHFDDVCFIYYYCMHRVYRQRMSTRTVPIVRYVIFRVDLIVIGICGVYRCFFISRFSHILFCLLRFYALPMLCCAFFIRRLMKFSKQIKNISSKRKIGSRSSATFVMVLTVMVEWNRNDLVVYGSLYWKNKCMDGEFENSVISHQHGVYTCSDFFSSSKFVHFIVILIMLSSELSVQFYLRFFFFRFAEQFCRCCLLFIFFMRCVVFFFSFSMPKWTQLYVALVMHYWAWRELSIFHTAIALSNGSINILRLLFQYSHRSTVWLRAQNQSNFATKYTSWRIKNALALNQIKLLYHRDIWFRFQFGLLIE